MSDPGPLEEERQHRVEAEEALRQLQERHRLLIDSVKDYAIIGLGPDGRVVSWNEGARRLLGYDEQDVLGRDFAFTFTQEDRQAHKPEKELAHARTAGSSIDENWTVRKDGSQFWASGVTAAVREGDAPSFVKIFRDLTERRRAEEDLAESAARLQAALAAARMGTWLWEPDTDRDHLDANLLDLLGLPPDTAVNTLGDFLRLVHPEDRERTHQAFQSAARGQQRLDVEFRVVLPDGTLRWLRDQGALATVTPGRPPVLTGACTDITDRRAIEEELRRSHEELERRVTARTAELQEAQQRALQAERLATIGETVAGLAHEGRNALQVIHACAERLAWRLTNHSEALELVAEIEKAQKRLQRLFDDVRGYAAPIVLETGRTDLAEVLRGAWRRVRAAHPDRDARLEEEVLSGCHVGTADGFRLEQVFFNIFDNTLAAWPGPVQVRLACSAAELAGQPAVRLAVRDNGPGLSEEQRRKIFEPFYTTKARGTGLGMAIARRIVEAHGGQITVGVSGPGTEIIVVLPWEAL